MRVYHMSKTHHLFHFFIGLRGGNGTFLIHGLRTEFKRIWPYGHRASAVVLLFRGYRHDRQVEFPFKIRE